MPGSGKSIGATVARELQIPVFVMGDVVREEVTRQKLPHSPQTLGRMMLKLREEYGPAVIALRCIEKILQEPSPCVVVDGARSEAEINAFKKMLTPVKVIAVHASPQIRFERLRKRGRADDAITREQFLERDARELDVGLGRVIAQADVMLINEGDLDALQAQVRQILKSDFGLD
ncbi:MAG: AAA family ATPase [Promethearchaeota archaeon]